MQKHQKETLSWQLMTQLLKEAFTEPPAPFDDAWLSYKNPPKTLFKDANLENEFILAKETIMYQIADLHLMKEAGTLNLPITTLYTGVDSPTNHRWYNFDPEGFLECANSYLTDSKADYKCDWNLLAKILYAGQLYE